MPKKTLSLKGGLLETTINHQLARPDAISHYFEVGETSPSGEKLPLFDTSNTMTSTSTGIKNISFSVENYQVTTNIPQKTVINFFSADNSKKLFNSVLYSEMLIGTEKRLFEKYSKFAWNNYQNEKSKWQKFILSLLKMEKYTYIGNSSLALQYRIYSLSNKIHQSTSLGSGNFVILPSGLLGLLHENANLEYIDPTSSCRSSDLSKPRFVKKGRIGTISIYHDTHAEWNSQDIIVGRMSRDKSGPGVHFCEYSNEYQSMEDPISPGWKAKLISKNILVDVGNLSGMYLADKISTKVKPWWMKLLGI
jgi:hypothetical protein